MTSSQWRQRAGTQFGCAKQPAFGTRGMVVTNHPLASAAGAEMLAAGGNAFDAGIASLFALSVCEPMMVGLLGGGMAHLRLADGTHTVIDGLSAAPAAARADMYRPLSQDWPAAMEVEERQNTVGPLSVATAGNLLSWCSILARFGTLPLADVMQPAIRLAGRGFAATPYLAECTAEAAPDLARDATISAVFLPGGAPIKAGARVVNGALAETLRAIAAEGPGVVYGGPVGAAVARQVQSLGGILAERDFTDFQLKERAPVRGPYRGHEIVGPPPPSSGGVHVLQMLNLLEGFDIAGLGFGTPASLHLLAEAMKLAFADRNAATADPDFVRVPVAKLIDKAYAAARRAELDPARARDWMAGVAAAESPNTTHLTVADGEGRIFCATQTINSLFGARFMVPGAGLIPNNYMALFDPRPSHALSIAPGKRVTTSQAPIIALKDGKPAFALGLVGGLRIFTSAMQAVVNLLDHGMSLQEAVEAPRLWTQGQAVEMEQDFPAAVRDGLAAMGHAVQPLPHVGGGMNAIRFHPDGQMEGAACWRADGTPIGLGGGLAKQGVRFWPDAPRANA